MIAALSLEGVGLLCAALAGLALAKALRTSGIEAVGWAMALAPALQGSLAALLIAIGLRPTAGTLLLATVAVAVVLWMRVRNVPPPVPVAKMGNGERWILWVAAAACAAFAVTTVAEPMWATDFLAVWGLKARTIFETAAIPSRLFQDPALFWSHPKYPLGIPLALAAMAGWMGEWNDAALGALYSWWQVATALAAAGFLARRATPRAGAWAALAIALFFPLYRAAHLGTAEIPMALAIVLLAGGFLDALESPPPAGTHARLAVAALLAASTKQEGMLWAILLAAALLAFGTGRASRWRAVACLVLPPLTHILAMRLSRGPVDARDFDWTWLAPARWGGLIDRAGLVLARIATVELVTAAIPLAAIVLIVLGTRHSFADPLFLPIALAICVYAFACALSAFDPIWHAKTSFSRLTLALYPTLCLVLATRLTRAKSEGSPGGLQTRPTT